MARARHGRTLALATGLAALVGCTAVPPLEPVVEMPSETRTTASGGSHLLKPNQVREVAGNASLTGIARGPSGLVGGNIVSSNASSLVASNSAGIVAGNTARYGVLGVTEVAIANAIVYLTDPDEHFFASKGKPLSATTDNQGRYTFPSGLPVGQIVIVNVILAENRREVGFTVSRAGRNEVNVSLASTYVTEFLRARATLAGKKMGDYDLSKLADLTAATQKAMDGDTLPLPDLAIGKIADMNHAYALVVGLNREGLGDMWSKVLGQRVLAMTTVAGTGTFGYGGNGGPATKATLQKPIGLARDAAGNIYIADEGAHVIRRVAKGGTISTFAGTGVANFSGDGGAPADAALNWPRAALVHGDQLIIADTVNMRLRRVDLLKNRIESIAGNPAVANGLALNDFGGDGGPAKAALLAGPRGLAFDSGEGLVFADTWDAGGKSWNHIRRIDPMGAISTLVGVDNVHGFNGDGKPGRETQINFANQLAVDAADNVYFTDTRNHRIRRYDVKTQLVSTVAGTGEDGTSGDGGKATAAQLSSPYGLALDLKTKPPTMFIAERGSRRLRVVLPDGKIRTLAGGGDRTPDGDARAMALNEPVDLLMEPDGNILVADSRGAKIRRLWLQWGY